MRYAIFKMLTVWRSEMVVESGSTGTRVSQRFDDLFQLLQPALDLRKFGGPSDSIASMCLILRIMSIYRIDGNTIALLRSGRWSI